MDAALLAPPSEPEPADPEHADTTTTPETAGEPPASVPAPADASGTVAGGPPATRGRDREPRASGEGAGEAGDDRPSSGELWIDRATVGAVLAVAAIAAIVSYRHMRAVALAHGEDPLNAAVIPLSVDGLIVAASMSMLRASRRGRRPPALAYALLVVASAASLAANVIHAEPDVTARVIAAWPSFALIGAYELLMRMIRTSGRATATDVAGAEGGQVVQQLLGTATAEPGGGGAGKDGPAGMPSAGDVRTAGGDAGVGGGGAPAKLVVLPSPGVPPRRRAGTKRAALRALLEALPEGDPRGAYALAKDLAPRVGLHEGTARRYVAEIRGESMLVA